VPEAWRGKHVTLLLERTKYSQAWLDGRSLGEQSIFLTPQEYELGELSPGKHALTIAVDNKRLPPTGSDAHQFSGNTQGNWNGIIGRLELRMTDPVWIDDAQVYPDAAKRDIRVKIRVKNGTQAAVADGTLTLEAAGEGIAPGTGRTAELKYAVGETSTEMELPLEACAALWDEFHPVLHTLTVRLKGGGMLDERRISFGLRNFSAAGGQFTVNGRPTFLRGRHDACVFPLTGHPPMDVDGWLAYFRILQSYGLNHVRFHTWTPPEAAFEAADRMGFYLQPELPFWGAFNQQARSVWEPEARRMLSQLGNHPSFVMFSMGNEHWSDAGVLAGLVGDLKAFDPRVLYVRGTSAFSGESRPAPADDYFTSSAVRAPGGGGLLQIRAANWGGSDPGHVQTGPANTMTDYTNAISSIKVPVITHEMGQYTVFPDFSQLTKYTGATRPYNLEHFQKVLADAGMAAQDADFARASGALAAICYREEIESCLRTPRHGGFELLDLQDFPGQGTALVGMLDAFMDSKGILTPEQWRQFCAPMVLLARFPKYVWTADETFTAEVDLAQYGQSDVPRAVLDWVLRDSADKPVLSGALPAVDLARGGLRSIGKVSIPLRGQAAPAQMRLEFSLPGSRLATSYPIWVYPPQADAAAPGNVTIARTFDAAAQAALAGGRRVLLVCDETRHLARTVGGGFASDFWNTPFFHNKPGTMGLLCDPAAPALAAFPTESHSNWQWFQIAQSAQPLVLDKLTPAGDRPIVQVIDNYDRCHKLGLVFELKVGLGRLLVCAADLVQLGSAHPEARQLLASLQAYAASDAFHPHSEVSPEALRDLFRIAIPMAGCTASASSTDNGLQGFAARQLIDGNESRGWRAGGGGSVWCQVAFPRPTDLGACEILWDMPGPGYAYLLQSSNDGTTWQTISDQTRNTFSSARQLIPVTAAGAKFVRVAVSATPGRRPAAIDEIRFFAPG